VKGLYGIARVVVVLDTEIKREKTDSFNVLIVDAYHDSDRGGAGILAGILNILYSVMRELDKPIRIGIVYRFSEDDERFRSAARHTKKAFPDVTIYGAPMKTFHRDTLPNRFKLLFILPSSFLKLCFAPLWHDKVVRAMKDADFVISKGGHFYSSRGRNVIKGFISTYMNAYTLLLTVRLRKKFALIAHTVGPFNNFPSRKIVKFIFEQARFLSTREEISKKILLDIGINGSSVKVLPDTAFALVPVSKDNITAYLSKKGLKEKQYAIITARYWYFPDSSAKKAPFLYIDYLNSLANIADYLIERNYVNKVVLVVHNDGQHSRHEDDSKPISAIFKKICHKEKTTIIKDDLSPAMQSALYGQAKIMIGTRMHSVIFALVGGAPAIAISYVHKTNGIMRMLDMEKYILDINSINLSDAKKMIDYVITSEKVVELANEKIKEFRTLLKMTLKEILVSSL